MCGIVGYVGAQQAAPILLEGLQKLEYRGYDSAGIAVLDGSTIELAKACGEIKNLLAKTHDGSDLHGYIGLGHTRWATHGAPTYPTIPHIVGSPYSSIKIRLILILCRHPANTYRMPK